MRFILVILATMLAAPQALAQSAMDRLETEMRASAPEGARVERVAPDEVRVALASDITFAFNRAEVRAEFEPGIRQLAQTLSRHPGMWVDVVGHADAVGGDAYNQQLSEQRANAVVALLRRYGADPRRLGASGMGEWEPVASNSTEWGRAQNRRVELRIKAPPK